MIRDVYNLMRPGRQEITRGELERRTGHNRRSIQSALSRLKRDGLVERIGEECCYMRWRAIGRPLTLPRRSGMQPGSRKALRDYGGNNGSPFTPAKMANLKNVKMVNGKYIPQPKPQTELERTWGWSASPRVATSSDHEFNEAQEEGVARPKET